MNKRNVFLVLCAALLTAALAGCAEPAPENIEDFGEKTKVSKVFTVSNTDEWAAAVKAIDGGGNDRNYIVNVTGPVDIPGPEGSTFSQPHSGVTISLRGTAPDAALILSGTGSLIALEEGEHLVLRDITLRGGEDNTATLVYVGGGSTLTMKAGAAVSDNNNNADFESVRGGGVHVAAGAVFTMQGGTISGNYDDGGYDGAGGGVHMAAGAIFTMEGGTISGNSGNWDNGGGVFVGAGAVFTMEGGEISGNRSGGGGGVYVSKDWDDEGGEKGTFIMRGGTISGNSAYAGSSGGGSGGGVRVEGGDFIMEGGEISGNDVASGSGGGVDVGDGTFTMKGGEIYGNDGDYGGGVNAGGDFTMEGGEIYGNKSSTGGGVFVSDGTFSLTGGIVHGSDGGDKANEARQGASLYRSGGRAVYGDGSPITRGRAVNETLTGR